MRKALVAVTLLALALFAGASWLEAQSSVITNPNVTGVSAGVTLQKVTVPYTAFVTAGVTSDVAVMTLPPKTQIWSVMADLTTTYACASVCTTGTLSMMLGTSAGGSQVLAAALDMDAAVAQFGDADAELGSGMTRAAAIQGGLFGSWTAATTLTMRLTSGTGNIGTGSATNLSQGSVTFYVLTRRF